ncbi:DNA repair exonuclease [Ectothiorhodospiraceae bacterium BW-2]|nr:DNA repair exonuclease [Ectothiorhodospiraceae bacterium BW-2]
MSDASLTEFKFIHAADIHLDSPLHGLSRYESAPVDAIRNACRRAFENLIDVAIEERVAFVLLAGDLYDGDWKDYSTGIFLSKQIGRLAQHNIRVFAVSGNHDAANRMTKSLESPANMKIFSSKRVETVKLDHLGVAIHGQSFPSQHVDENLAAGFCDAAKGLFNIGLLHTSLDGREGHANYAPCSLDDLRSKEYQYWALGHIHKQEIVAKEPYVIFPGCIQGRHIRETGAKGCVVVTVNDGVVSDIEKIALDVLRWSLCVIDITDIDEMRGVLERVRKRIDQEIASAEGRPLAMRIRLQGATTVADELAAYPDRLDQQIKALSAETAGDELWLERVENLTNRKLDLESTLADDNPMGKLLQEIVTITRDTDNIDGLKQKVAELRQKAPSETFGHDSILNLDEEQTLHRVVDEAKQMLIGRLLTVGAAK